MNPQDQENKNQPQPVAYDAEGRPLYHHPPQNSNSSSSDQPASEQVNQQQSSGGNSQQSPSSNQTQEQSPNPREVISQAADMVYESSPPTLPIPNPDAPKNEENPLQQAIDDAPGPPMSHVTSRPESAEGENFNPRLRSQYANEPKIVHASRPVETKAFAISERVKKKHQASIERYPYLNLTEGEFVILDIKRHPIGMLLPIGITVLLLFGIISFASFYPSIYSESVSAIMPTPPALFGIAVLLAVLVVLGGAVALWVYLQNQFFMTNESVIQEIQTSLFARHEQTVSLGSIEDASYIQAGILQTVLNYGTIRLSTEGEETTYIFKYVENPRKQIAILTNAIEAFKNGRPVNDPQDN